jgi:hypothetical protein
LTKLEESLRRIKYTKDFDKNKDSYYILTLMQYINDSLLLTAIDQENIEKISKILINLDVIINLYTVYIIFRHCYLNLKVL